MMNECGNKWILFAEGLCCVWEWNDCVRDQRPEPDGQCWWFLSIQDPELHGDWQYGVWDGLGLIVFTPQSSYQYTDTRQTWDQLWMIKFWNDSTSELYLSTRSIFHSRSLFLAFLPSTVRCSAVESLCEGKQLEIYLSFFRAVRGAGHLEQR